MEIEPSGVILLGECTIQTPLCTALTPAPITAVWALPGRIQINVCRTCLEEMIRENQWKVAGARVAKGREIAAT